MKQTAYIALGSNIAPREVYLKKAIQLLHQHPCVTVFDISSIYETEPVGYTEQDLFLNMVVGIKTSLSPFKLLQLMQSIENELGRTREIRWGPRTADLDILLYNRENIETEQLIIPHPRMNERLFVLIPLLEIFPDFKGSIDDVENREGVRVWKQKSGVEEFVRIEN
ncbi:2-amino-4-hydroxy-6-hydroxymethyldihydropteridine diphosphokinase [Bacillus sp. CLL-7-23]|uniref:2-amino-4-hydroxy-6-hydroxymethyldihydropteridine diphosphokinase n=1 Tax=Bacillus changyiensis TaxID=3004103 RepID=A0ABT4X7U0_9BACI|nr:2-amino-4-hydroxy-6-hydroxymethyldihydropteridine diphosphokinase [Bacillus changyiensis]MDA7028355.1 2-amino-4-hydroxy-6-hydroxymethyldihydropteridine diphosphokinase [Bacillus changyiensis]